MAMDLTRTLHPPGGATALIAVVGPPAIKELGYMYVLQPVALGVSIMVAIAVVFNNLVLDRRYPKYWY
jgi:CBS-domain-containing membrane protein